jgi:hypothetical protein
LVATGIFSLPFILVRPRVAAPLLFVILIDFLVLQMIPDFHVRRISFSMVGGSPTETEARKGTFVLPLAPWTS